MIYCVPTAFVKEHPYLDLTTYYELSIHWSFIELLLTGGFYVADQLLDLILGSSLT